MPLIIGQLNANINVVGGGSPETPTEKRDDERARARATAEARFDRERRIDQRDPDLLGGS